MANGKKRSPWFYVALGCGVIVVLVLVAAGAMTWFAVKTARDIKADMTDPAIREAKVLKALGASRLPEGYHPMMAFKVPFFGEFAILADEQIDFGDESHSEKEPKRIYAYARLLRKGADKKQELRDYLEGKRDNMDVLADSNITIEGGEILARGSVEVGGLEVPYLAQQGSVHIEGANQEDREGILTLMLFDCPQDPKLRVGVWVGPEVTAPEGSTEVDYSGTPADPEAISQFLSHFDLCASSDS